MLYHREKLPLFLGLNFKDSLTFLLRIMIHPTILEIGIAPIIKQSYYLFFFFIKIRQWSFSIKGCRPTGRTK